VVGCTRCQRPFDTVEILIGADDDHRHLAAARPLAQPKDEHRCLALRPGRRDDDEIGGILGAKAERPVAIGKALHDRPFAERGRQSFEDLQVGDGVVDDDDKVRRHAAAPEIAVSAALYAAALPSVTNLAARGAKRLAVTTH
jgi:hypothetical protein